MREFLIIMVMFILIVAGLAWARVITLPYWLSFERQAYVASHQYVEARRKEIATMIAECKNLSEGPQRLALRRRIDESAALLPRDAIPNTAGC